MVVQDEVQVNQADQPTDGDQRFKLRRDRQPVSGIHLMIGNEAFQLVDGHRLVFDSAPAVGLAGVRANPAAGKQERITFTDGVDGAFIVTRSNLGDILGNIDFRRTGLSAGCQAVVTAIEMHQALGHGFDLHDILGANRFAGAAPDTFFFIHYRVAFAAHFDGIELTGIDAVAQPDAPNGTFPLAPGQGRLCSTGIDTQMCGVSQW